jgi:hypothetical protein
MRSAGLAAPTGVVTSPGETREHSVVQLGPLSYCPTCHLLAPCLDGEILARAQISEAGFTVDDIRAVVLRLRLATNHRSSVSRVVRVPAWSLR